MNQQQIILPNDVGLAKYATDADFDLVASAGGWLPRLQLFGSNSDLVKKGKFPMAHWGLVSQKDSADDLGPEVEVIPISWRPKAMRLSENGTAPVSYFNPKSEDFLHVQKDSEQPESGCMFGPEFLLWIPSVKRFATYFMSSKTSRRQAPELRALMGSGAVCGVQYIETSKYSWHGPTIRRAVGQITELPDMEDVKKYVNSFNNPEESSIEFDTEKLEDTTRTR